MIDLAVLRDLRGIKRQREIASMLGISQNHYSQIENGVRKPSLELTNRIAQFFGVSIDEILLNPPLPSPSKRKAEKPLTIKRVRGKRAVV
jgi:transcriptional regulator with XRE-family HTH domain